MKLTLPLLLLLIAHELYAQQTFDKYCDIILIKKTIAVEYQVDQVDYGQKDGKFRIKDPADSRQLDSLENKTFASPVTILDRMKRRNWIFVTAFPGNDSTITHLVFLRSFPVTDIIEEK